MGLLQCFVNKLWYCHKFLTDTVPVTVITCNFFCLLIDALSKTAESREKEMSFLCTFSGQDNIFSTLLG